MPFVVARSGCACCGTLTGIVDTRKVFDANVGVFATRGERGIDGTAESSWAVVSGLGVGRIVLLISYTIVNYERVFRGEKGGRYHWNRL